MKLLGAQSHALDGRELVASALDVEEGLLVAAGPLTVGGQNSALYFSRGGSTAYDRGGQGARRG